jgi:hypothetical protein
MFSDNVYMVCRLVILQCCFYLNFTIYGEWKALRIQLLFDLLTSFGLACVFAGFLGLHIIHLIVLKFKMLTKYAFN